MAIQALKSGSLYLIEPNHFGIVHVDGNPSLRAQNDLFSCGHLENVLPYSSRHSQLPLDAESFRTQGRLILERCYGPRATAHPPQGPARPLSEIPTPPATAGVDVGLVLLQPAGHGLTDRFHLVGNLRIDSALARTGEWLLRALSQRHRNRVVQGFPGSTQKEEGPDGLSGPSSL
jgi:hypothetical protein